MRTVEVIQDVDGFELDADAVVDAVHTLDKLAAYAIPPGDLNIAYIDAETCCELHRQHFGDPSLTDVMTFPGDPADDHAGDIAICPEYARASSREHGVSFAAEITLYLIHAWLHLAGLRDDTAAACEEMRAAEKQLMDQVVNACGLPACKIDDA